MLVLLGCWHLSDALLGATGADAGPGDPLSRPRLATRPAFSRPTAFYGGGAQARVTVTYCAYLYDTLAASATLSLLYYLYKYVVMYD